MNSFGEERNSNIDGIPVLKDGQVQIISYDDVVEIVDDLYDLEKLVEECG